jgi:hypothetical protein
LAVLSSNRLEVTEAWHRCGIKAGLWRFRITGGMTVGHRQCNRKLGRAMLSLAEMSWDVTFHALADDMRYSKQHKRE